MIEEVGFWGGFWESDAVLVIGVGIIFGAFDKLFDLLIELRDWFNPMYIVKQYEEGVVLRFGKYHRNVSPGFHWKWPCSIEQVMKDIVVRRTSYLGVQSLTTKDGHNINSSPIVIYSVGNIKRWELEVDDAADAVNDITYGLNDELCTETNLAGLHTTEYAAELTRRVRAEGVEWGARIKQVKFSDRSKSRSMRIWTGDGMSTALEDE